MTEVKKKALDLKLLVRLFAFSAPYKRTLYFAMTLSIVLAVITPLRPRLIEMSVDKFIANKDLHGLLMLGVFQMVMLLVETGLRFWFMYRINWLGQTVVNDIRTTVFKKILNQDIAFFDKTPIGTLTTRTINDIESVNDIFSEGFISIVADLLTILSIIGVMLYSDWRLTLVCLTAFPLLILATWWFKEEVNKSFQRVRNAVAALNAFVQEHLQGMQLVQAFVAENRELRKFDAINTEHRDANIKGIFAYSVFFPIVDIILAISLGLLVWYGAVRIIHLHTTQGVIVSFVMYLNLLFRPLRMMADKFNVLQMGLVAGDRVFAVLDSTENHLSREDAAGYSATPTGVKTIAGDIRFEDVRFSYKPGVPVLKGISFHIPAGKTMAVVGHTGAGKTSLISILNRLYEIEGGSIKIDGKDIKEYDVHELRSHIGIVLQDVFLFSGTIADNISMRNPEIDRDSIVHVCQMLGIHNFIMSLPGNYDFDIMERGNNISQGQRQLLSFARALLYDPSVLILDEATSSVDSESEQLIQHAIDTLIQGRTSIVIAHRLSTVRKADEIIVMDHGHITERGNHENLRAAKGAYFELYTAVEKVAG